MTRAPLRAKIPLIFASLLKKYIGSVLGVLTHVVKCLENDMEAATSAREEFLPSEPREIVIAGRARTAAQPIVEKARDCLWPMWLRFLRKDELAPFVRDQMLGHVTAFTVACHGFLGTYMWVLENLN